MAFNQDYNDLAALLAQNLTFDQPQQQPQQQQPQQQAQEEPILYSSQHYYHCAHLDDSNVTPAADVQRPSSVPPQNQQSLAEQILLQHGVDPSVLGSTQLDLFKTADDEQKWRLISLWKIYPPSTREVNPAVSWSASSIQQEEQLAKLRHDRAAEEEEQKRSSLLSMDGTPLTPVQDNDGHWIANAYTEPYMMSGYEYLARREYMESASQQYYDDVMSKPREVPETFYRSATDPVYNQSNGQDWAKQQQAMENQYGAFQSEMEL